MYIHMLMYLSVIIHIFICKHTWRSEAERSGACANASSSQLRVRLSTTCSPEKWIGEKSNRRRFPDLHRSLRKRRFSQSCMGRAKVDKDPDLSLIACKNTSFSRASGSLPPKKMTVEYHHRQTLAWCCHVSRANTSKLLRCRANLARIRQSRPDSGLGLKARFWPWFSC